MNNKMKIMKTIIVLLSIFTVILSQTATSSTSSNGSTTYVNNNLSIKPAVISTNVILDTWESCTKEEIGKKCDIAKKVCGVKVNCSDRSSKNCIEEFESRCNACTTGNFEGVFYATCGDYINSLSNVSSPPVLPAVEAYRCTESDRKRTIEECKQESMVARFMQTCGIKSNCTSTPEEPCEVSYTSTCFACIEENVAYVEFRECYNWYIPDYVFEPYVPHPFEIRHTCPYLFENQNSSTTANTGVVGSAAVPANASIATEEKFLFDASMMIKSMPEFVPEEKKGSDTVCAFKKGCYNAENCYKELKRDDACKATDIVEYFEGECPKPKECNSKDRNAMCTMEYKGVCAVKNETKQLLEEGYMCKDGLCLVSSGTVCQACSDPEVKRVYDNECYLLNTFYSEFIYNPIQLVDRDCEEKERLADMCTEDYTPVCGRKDCKEENCQKQYSNACMACKEKEVKRITSFCDFELAAMGGIATDMEMAKPLVQSEDAFYTTYASLSSATTLEKSAMAAPTVNSNKNNASSSNQIVLRTAASYNSKHCTTNASCGSTPVCAIQYCTSGLCPLQFDNNCKACNSTNTTYFVEEPCSNISNKRVYSLCSSSQASTNCASDTKNNRKVCAKFKSTSTLCTEDNCHKSYTSLCLACSDSNIESFYEGECSSKHLYTTLAFIGFLLLSLF